MTLLQSVFLLSVFSWSALSSFPSCNEVVDTPLPFCATTESSYQKLLPPRPSNNSFSLELAIHDVGEASDADSSVTLDMEITMRWRDPRLRPINPKEDGTGHLVLDPALTGSLWMPHLAVYNLKAFERPSVLPDRSLGTLSFSLAESVVSFSFPCRVSVRCPPFHFADYPMDKQECLFLLGSHGRDSSEMVVDGGFRHEEEAQRPLPVQVTLHPLKDEERLVEAVDEDGKVTAIYSATGIRLEIVRTGIFSHVLTWHLPAFLCLFASWISFTVSQSAVAGRLLFLVFLTKAQIVLLAGLSSSSSFVDLTAVQVYCLVCFLLSAAALLEFGLVICQRRSLLEREDEDSDGDLKQDLTEEEDWNEEELGSAEDVATKWWNRLKTLLKPEYIDHCSVVLFPAVFVAFNIYYWNNHLAKP